jgi:hypothetical protein
MTDDIKDAEVTNKPNNIELYKDLTNQNIEEHQRVLSQEDIEPRLENQQKPDEIKLKVFDVLNAKKELKRVVATEVTGGCYAALKIFDNNLNYANIAKSIKHGQKVLIDIAQPNDKKKLNKVPVVIPERLLGLYMCFAKGIVPSYSHLAEFAYFIIKLRADRELPIKGLQEIIEKYKENVEDQKKGALMAGMSFKDAIASINKRFEEENLINKDTDKLTIDKEIAEQLLINRKQNTQG